MRKLASWLLAVALVVRALALIAPIVAAFVLTTAIAAGGVEDPRARVALGVAFCLGLPLLLRWRLGRFLATRKRPLRPPSWMSFVAVSNLAVAGAVGFGFADDSGRALRRHGDWFCGESNGLVVRKLRGGVGVAAAFLETFDPPRELAPVVIPPDPTRIPEGPWRPGEGPPEALPTVVGWFHPLAGPRRALPLYE